MMNKKPTAKKAPSAPMGYAKGGMTFKPCAGCSSAAKCKSMGQCMKKSGAGKKPMGYAKGGMVQKMPKAC
jgi:hypothetical protein